MKSHKAVLTFLVSCLVMSLQVYADTHAEIIDVNLRDIPKTACLSRYSAESEAEILVLKAAQVYCRSEGFGWRSALIKQFGSRDCQRCDSGRYSCRYSNISMECRKAEPRLSWIGWISGNPLSTARSER